MKIPLELTFRHMEPTAALEAKVHEGLEKLERISDRIISCRVAIDAPHQHQRKGKRYEVRIDLTVPGDEIVIKRNPPERQANEDLYVAIRDAFEAARRQLASYEERRRGEVKTHA